MLYDDERNAGFVAQRADQVQQRIHLGIVERRHDFVEQEYAGPGAQRAGEFDPGLLRKRQVRGQLAHDGGQSDSIQALRRQLARPRHVMT